jgi:hypothetical protein
MTVREVSVGDFNRRLIDVVERLAVDYEGTIGLRPVMLAVTQARDELTTEGSRSSYPEIVDVETRARELLAASYPQLAEPAYPREPSK